MPAIEKLCCVCGKDVASAKRVKDPRGRYFCEPCAKVKQAQPSTAAAPVAATAAGAKAPPPMPKALPADDLELDLAPMREVPKENTPMAACGRCKKLFPERQVRNIDGEFVCGACLAQQNRPQPAKAKPAAKGVVKTAPKGAAALGAVTAVPPAEEDENAMKFTDTLGGGALISGVAFALAIGAFFALYRYLPEKGVDSTALCLAAAIIRSVVLLFSTAGLIISMLIAARIVGGISFGFIGAVVYKSILCCLVLGAVDYFFSHYGLGVMSLWGFRFLVTAAALVVMFKIDFFEAAVLSAVNLIMNIALGIVLLVMLIQFAGAVSKDKDNAGADAKSPQDQAKEVMNDIPRQAPDPVPQANPDPGAGDQPQPKPPGDGSGGAPAVQPL